MWKIELDGIPFEADVRELLQAFYPEDGGAHVRGKSAAGEYRFTVTFPDENVADFTCPIIEDRFEAKCEVKRALYNVLSQHENKTLPWGTLTGIRPTKLALQGLDFKKVFLTSDEKISLCFETAHREEKVLEKIDYQNGWSLYVGIPFCPTRCLYCSFTAYPIGLWKDKKKDYISALLKEI